MSHENTFPLLSTQELLNVFAGIPAAQISKPTLFRLEREDSKFPNPPRGLRRDERLYGREQVIYILDRMRDKFVEQYNRAMKQENMETAYIIHESNALRKILCDDPTGLLEWVELHTNTERRNVERTIAQTTYLSTISDVFWQPGMPIYTQIHQAIARVSASIPTSFPF